MRAPLTNQELTDMLEHCQKCLIALQQTVMALQQEVMQIKYPTMRFEGTQNEESASTGTSISSKETK